MEYQKFEHTLIVRLDRGEEIVDCLLDLARREHITLASVNGLGAVNQVTAGVFSPVTKQYRSHEFQGDFEIICLHGTLTTQDGRLVISLHIKVAYGLNIAAIVKSITHKVKYVVENATGLSVARIDVAVDDILTE